MYRSGASRCTDLVHTNPLLGLNLSGRMTPRRHRPLPDGPEEQGRGSRCCGGCEAFPAQGLRAPRRRLGRRVAIGPDGADPRPRHVSTPQVGHRSGTASPAITSGSVPAGLALDTLDLGAPGANAEVWEKVIAKLRAGSMPPPGLPRPDAATYRAVASAAGARHRPRVGGQSESRPDRRGPSPQSRGIQQRDSRSVRARPRRETAAARRRDRGRQLRQFRGLSSRFRPRTSSATCRWLVRSRGSRRVCRRRARRSRRSRFRCT